MPLFRMLHSEDDGSLIGLEPANVEDDDLVALEEIVGGKVCEDWPCCGHEWGDCDGSKYGSDESIKQAVYDRIDAGEDDWPMDGEE